MSNGRNGAIPIDNSINPFESVWTWGDPMGTATYPKGKPRSYADALVGSQWLNMRIVTRKEFYRTLYHWQSLLHQRNGDIDLLHKVLEYDIEAKQLGITNVQEYIAERIDRTRQAVSLYQQMIDMAAIQHELATNYLHNDDNPYVIGEGQVSKWNPTERHIQKKMASIPRDCAVGYDGCTGQTNNGLFAICYPCHKRLKHEQEKAIREGKPPKPLIPEWVTEEESRIRAEHRKYAKNACYEDHYGTISIDEAESYLDAA